MMPAAKHGDPQMGIDIHLCVVPPSPSPVPLPTPHMSIVFDPFDYVPVLGATVTVCGMKRATAGTNGIAVHIPPGFPFAPMIPSKDDELFMGSATVTADGEPFSFLGVPVLACQVAGMMSPPRLKKKGSPKAMVLPTIYNLAIPTTVFVGGPPTISMMGMAFKAGFATLGKFAKAFKKLRQAVFKGMKPSFLKCLILRAEPVNIITGEVSVEQEDFALPGRLPLQWVRSYSSNSQRRGVCGYGWETPADARLEVHPDGSAMFHHPTAGPALFSELPRSPGDAGSTLDLWDGALLSDHGHEFHVRTKEDRVYHFPKAPYVTDKAGGREHLVSRMADLCGNAWDFERRGGDLVSLNESAGRRIEVESRDGLIRTLALHIPESGLRHVFVRYEQDAAGDLTTVFDALREPYRFTYDRHHLVRHTNRNGLSFYYEYHKTADGWRVTHTWGDGGLYDYRFEHSPELNETRITDSLGHVSIVKFDDRGLPICEIDALDGLTSFGYDDVGRTTSVIDPDGHRTEYEYDDRGNLLQLTRPDGTAIVTACDHANKAVSITDPNGARWQQIWDERGLLIGQISPLGAEWHYVHDAHGQLVAFINPLGARTTLTSDGQGNPTRITDALGYETTFRYDALGHVISKADPLNQQTRYQHDAKGRLLRSVLPSGASINCSYDREDNLACYVDDNGAETRLEYFGLSEVRRRIQPDGTHLNYRYDTEERLVSVTNQRGESHVLERDGLGRIVAETDYWGQTRRYAYTAAGYMSTSSDPLGRTIRYQTDSVGRVLKRIQPHPTQCDAIQTETFEYDANGNLVACGNDAVRVEREFDQEDRLVKERIGSHFLVASVYDANGNRTARTTTVRTEGHVHSSTVRYRYDGAEHVEAVEIGGLPAIAIARNPLGQVTSEVLSPRLSRHLAYSSDGYLVAQEIIGADVPPLQQTYAYDPVGNLTERRDSALGVDRYTYDPLGRLVAHLYAHSALDQYLVDAVGSRLHTIVRQHADQHGHESRWQREGDYNGTRYSFDRAGNLTDAIAPHDRRHFSWDAQQRLVESVADGRVTTYLYDPLGRRVAKTTEKTATLFFWDGESLLGEARLAQQEEQMTLLCIREWVHYPDTFVPLFLLEGHHAPEASEMRPLTVALYLYDNDPNGCPTRLLNTSGQVVWAAQYQGWGAVRTCVVNRVENPIRLQGQYADDETRLHYNRHRYYDPTLGQFVSPDPLGLEAGTDPYRLAPNIWSWVDPLGLKCHLLPSFRKVTIDWEHIRPRHLPGGAKTLGRTVFAGMSEQGVGAALKRAWPNMRTVHTQGERLLIRGIDPKTGVKIEGWYNKTEKLLETAYPI